MINFYRCINAICVENLGFSERLFSDIQCDPVMKERILADIIIPEFNGKTPHNLFKRIIFKYRRWQANAWKQNLCYGDSRFKAFWVGVWSHLMKPSMI